MMFRKKKQVDDLTLLGHLSELRMRLIVCFLAVVGGLVVGFIFAGELLAWLLRLPGELVYLAPAEAFYTHIRIAVTIGMVLAAPMILYQMAVFVAPGLTTGERGYLYWGIPASLFLFAVGVFFAYAVMLPLSYRFFLGFGSGNLQAMISVGSYISFVFGLILPFGFVFQLPLLVMILTGIGLLTPEFLRRNRKVAVIAIFAMAALLTPPDIISQVLMAGPLFLLYELSVLIANMINRRRKEALL